MASGTTSKILWHFTGGPTWDKKTGKQEAHPRLETEALSALVGILDSNELRYTSHEESIKYHFTSPGPVELIIPPFCCVAEIPIQHLAYHSQRHGKFAIGFEREYLLEKRFRPASYFLIEKDFMAPAVMEVYLFVNKCRASSQTKVGKMPFSVLGAFIKSFSKTEFDTVYSEREWRRLKEGEEAAFNFDPNKVKFVLAPEKAIRNLRVGYGDKYPETNFLEYELLLEH